jgi:hypothetical protein
MHERLEADMTVHQHSSPALSLTPAPSVPFVAMILTLAAPPILSLLMFEAPLVLPSLSVISLGLAGIVALLAWATASKPDRAQITLWDLSGLYAFLGFAAGMLSEPQYLMEFWSLPASDHAAPR